ncbi:GNAT family N-acetyltransferase [Peribacillus kribbensis]|uniref:GNAT family N-acetyltransferase n=1 Tax=Peribacillus kribbensis TaxID=356658 RepID=UPI000407EDC4|nr:GNAT family N-acetyltransferase [Peribacillus kribbensis]
MLSVTIRRPEKKDEIVLHPFFKYVIEDTFQNEGLTHLKEDIRQEIKSKEKLLKLDLDSLGEDRFFLLAANPKNHILGTVEFGPCSTLIAECTNGSYSRLVEIGTVLVHPDFQNKGIGRLLFNAILLTLQAKEIREFCLDSGYQNAQRIWTKWLGKPNYLLLDYWGENHPHMIWKRPVNLGILPYKIN